MRVNSLDWIIVTKRIGNAADMLLEMFGDHCRSLPAHMIVLATICNQAEWDRDRAKLFRLKERWRLKIGVSYEPALGPCDWQGIENIDWLIVGGESRQALQLRPTMPFDLEWGAAARIAAQRHNVPFFFKQLGSKPRLCGIDVPKSDAHGRNLDDAPTILRVREYWQARRDTTINRDIPF